MAVPKKKKSRSKVKKRRATQFVKSAKAIICPKCGSFKLPHAVCKTCGTYKGREVLDLEKRRKRKERKLEKEKETEE